MATFTATTRTSTDPPRKTQVLIIYHKSDKLKGSAAHQQVRQAPYASGTSPTARGSLLVRLGQSIKRVATDVWRGRRTTRCSASTTSSSRTATSGTLLQLLGRHGQHSTLMSAELMIPCWWIKRFKICLAVPLTSPNGSGRPAAQPSPGCRTAPSALPR